MASSLPIVPCPTATQNGKDVLVARGFARCLSLLIAGTVASVNLSQDAFAPRVGATLISLQLGEFLVQLCQAIWKSGVGTVERREKPSPDLSNPHQVEFGFRNFASAFAVDLRAV